MAKVSEIYKCNICGNIVEVHHAGPGQLVCCNQPMELLEAKTKDEGMEKHVPVIEIEGNKVTVKVGSVPHPMEEDHHIDLIEILGGGKVIASAKLYPGWKPEAVFHLESTEGITAREICNKHGLWKSS
ncbi:MAG: desulfoferrodoxin [Nanoarchaeota archaeon]|nr:desulfoferrodoxin [Nanoarchaeota archaeon]